MGTVNISGRYHPSEKGESAAFHGAAFTHFTKDLLQKNAYPKKALLKIHLNIQTYNKKENVIIEF